MQQRRQVLPIKHGDSITNGSRSVRQILRTARGGTRSRHSGRDARVENRRANERRRQRPFQPPPPVNADVEEMFLALPQAARADESGPQVGEQGVLMRDADRAVPGGAEVEGVRCGGRDEEGRVGDGGRCVPGVVRDGLPEWNVLVVG